MGALSRETGAFVLGVDHFGKVSETGTRGSSAKEAAADVVLAMLATRSEAGEISNTRMAVRKVRGAAAVTRSRTTWKWSPLASIRTTNRSPRASSHGRRRRSRSHSRQKRKSGGRRPCGYFGPPSALF